ILMGEISRLRAEQRVRTSAFVAWAFGTCCATVAHIWFPSVGEAIVGLVAGAVSYYAITMLAIKSPVVALEKK
ncbi:MAG: cytosine permease, partial [Ewingella sp.]|nr:cytosine permease [Ewingella sp.]